MPHVASEDHALEEQCEQNACWRWELLLLSFEPNVTLQYCFLGRLRNNPDVMWLMHELRFQHQLELEKFKDVQYYEDGKNWFQKKWERHKSEIRLRTGEEGEVNTEFVL